jgi:hypothetical protein
LIAESLSAWVPRPIIVASIAPGFGVADASRSFAGCGGYCEAQQARAMCHQAIKIRGLKAWEREAEFQKCKRDPVSYLLLEELTDEDLE